MEPVGSANLGPLQRCREDSGLPVRLIGESELLSLPATEELSFDALDAGSGERARHTGTRARLTSHRLYWWVNARSEWLALRLDAVAEVEIAGGFLRSKHVFFQLRSGQTLSVYRGESAKLGELLDQVQAALAARGWLQGSYEAAAMGGLQRILGQRGARQQAVEETLDLALSDLKSLREYAAQTVAAAKQVATKGGSGEAAGVQQMLQDFGLVTDKGALVASGGQTPEDVVADVKRVCQAALEKRGGLGMLLVHDAFCLVNRARGTAMLSPEEVMSALKYCTRPGGVLRLRQLGSTGAFAVSLARTSDAQVDEQLLKLAETCPLSAFRMASELSVTAAEAKYLLRDAESRAVLVRDDAPNGVFYYRNFFADY